jgi:ADP-L-glycero-D-manno-heptose 6-epimerase
MIVVTGAAGFIGSNIVSTLNERGRDDIAICDWLGSGPKWRNLAKAGFVEWISPPDLTSWLARRTDVEAIVHMGAISSTTAQDGDAVIANNFRLSLDLLDFCTDRAIPFLYASSAAVYGDGGLGFEDDVSPAAVRALRPLNLYGWSKRQFDFVVADRIARRAQMPPSCVGLRFFNVFGPNEYHKDDMQSIVAKIAGPIGRGEGITLFKSHREGIDDGDQRRDFIYVKDAVTLSLYLHDRRTTGIFNIGTGHARSFRELAVATFAAFGRAPEIDYVDMPESIRDKYQYFTQASLQRIRSIDFATPFSSLEESVADYVQHYLDRDDPYR